MAQGRAITSEQVERMLTGLRNGMTRRAASAYGGFHRQTLYRMMADDVSLVTEIERAEDEAEAAMTQIVVDAAPKNWQASAWWLERRKYAEYAKRERLELTVDVRAEAERLAAATGMDPETIIAEAQAVLASSKR